MNELIPDPARGGDILPWARGVTDVCRRFGAIGSGNLLVREGPGGVGYESLPENRRGKTAAVIHGCFDVQSYAPPDSGDPYLAIVNRFYRIGHRIEELSAAAPPSVSGLVDHSNPVLALVATADTSVPSVSLVHYSSFSAMEADSEDMSKAVIPLYLFRFSEDGDYLGIEIDFRNMPAFAMTED